MTTTTTPSEPSTASSSNTTTTYSRPVVPSWYFDETAATTVSNNNYNNYTNSIPTAVFGRCVDYCDWGDLAKLACVQSSWSNIVKDTAKSSPQSTWEYAQALLVGDCGLQRNPTKAIELLQQLVVEESRSSCSVVTIDETTGKPILNEKTTNNDDDNNGLTTPSCYALAIRQLADCYLNGVGVTQNADCAVAWLETSFQVGDDVDAAHEIALIHEHGRHGIEICPPKAFEWFEKAANAGHVESMTELGLCYELGIGVDQSDELSLDWYTKAANLGHATAKYAVGEAFEEARGVPQSDQEACLWYHRAAVEGCVDSKKALRRLYEIARIIVPGVGEILRE